MSCHEIGSHSRSRADVITRSTARRCDASVSSRHAKFASASRILSQRLAQLSRNRNRNPLLTFALHAGDLLLATGHQLFPGSSMSPVLEVHRDAVLCEFTETHAQDDLVEGDKLRHKLTRHACGHEPESVLERFDNLGSAVTQEHLATAPLPAHVVGVVDVSDQVCL